MKKDILINSYDRTYGTSSSFQIQYTLRQFYKCNSFYISSVVMPSSFYVVTSNNNLLYFVDNNQSTQSLTITPGNYSPSELVSTIQTWLTGLNSNAGWAISYSTNTGLFSFSTSNLSFGLDAHEYDNILYNLMGFLQQIYNVDTTTKTSTYVADLTGPKYVKIVSNALSFKSSFEPGSTNIGVKNVILRIPVKVNSFDMIVYENYNDINNMIPFQREFPNIIDISLIDEEGNTLNLNGTEWSFVITAIFEEIYPAKY